MKGPQPKPSQTPLLVGRGYPQYIYIYMFIYIYIYP